MKNEKKLKWWQSYKLYLSVMSIVLILIYTAYRPKQAQEKKAEVKLTERVLHPRFRENPKPAEGNVAATNPPVMLCPLLSGKTTRYSFRLSQDKEFKDASTMQANDLPYAIFNPHQLLEPGTWYWQYKYNEDNWLSLQSFQVTSASAIFDTPSPRRLIEKVPLDHPRVFLAENIRSFRQRVAENADANVIIKKADALLSLAPPRESMGIPDLREATTKVQQKKLALDASKRLGAAAGKGPKIFCEAYILTGEEKYAKAAIRWATEIASWDPNGVSMTNNFGDSECMLVMAYTYDACYDLLSDQQKTALLKSITIRGNRFYNLWVNMLEAKVFSGHVWQHILHRLFQTSLATLHDIPEASQWLTYIYEVWLARAPVLGPDDGGWWNGTHYAELNGLTLLDIPMTLQHYTGVDFIRSPFYENNPYWLLYAFPPNSYSEGFGNGTEKQFGQKLGMLGYADALSRITGNPYAAWYVDQHLNALDKTLIDDDEFRWFRLKWKLPDRPKALSNFDLPQARAFPETGTVNMHTDSLDPSQNLMVSMRASPYGSTSHSHSDQNSFNIQYGGKKLFYNSGYRPSMGVPHYNEWFKATIGHNTVLIDGKGQPTGSAESYGWLPRFLHGAQISYALGDASMAYDNEKEEPQKAGLTRFRRHIVLLRPSTIVIYDELEADHHAVWSWLIHSHDEITLDKENQQIQNATTTARSQVNLFGTHPLDIELSTKFDPEPVNFRNLTDEDGNILVYKDQWHIYAKSSGKATRYLAVFQVKPQADKRVFEQLQRGESGWISAGNWKIQAELDASKPASFEITSTDGSSAIMYGKEQIKAGDNTYQPEYTGSTLLVEKINGKMVVKEGIDKVPIGRN